MKNQTLKPGASRRQYECGPGEDWVTAEPQPSSRSTAENPGLVSKGSTRWFAAFLSALMMLPIMATGCATPTHDDVRNTRSDFEPWTPTRKGNHPADLHLRPPPTIDADTDMPSWLATDDKTHSRSSITAAGPIQATGFILWRLYSNTFSRAMGDSCRFSPSCSRFAVEAANTGPQAAVLTFARLQRSHLNDGFYEHTEDHYLIDPPSHYFFWRSDRGLDAHRTSMPTDHAWYVFIRATDDLPESFFNE